MELGLKGKIAFVAASSKGLGKAVAAELSREGAIVIINGRRKNSLEETQNDLSKTGNEVFAVSGDLSNEKERRDVIDQILKRFGKIDILITNTGGPPSGNFSNFQKSDWDKAYELLLGSAVSLIQDFLPGMKEQNWGRIIAITSQAVKQPVDNLILSNSVRASVAGLIKSLSNELGSFNITVNNVMPGYTKTDRLKNLISNDPEIEKVKKDIPLQRFAEPEEFAAAVAFLASERASYITGISLGVDGGWIKNMI